MFFIFVKSYFIADIKAESIVQGDLDMILLLLWRLVGAYTVSTFLLDFCLVVSYGCCSNRSMCK